MIRAIIADDEPLAREGIRLLLRDDPDVDVVGEAADASSRRRSSAGYPRLPGPPRLPTPPSTPNG